MRTATKERITLHKDQPQEARLRKQVQTQRDNLQAAVDALNNTGMKPMQPDELVYFVNGGSEWLSVRWQNEQEVPAGFVRDKYLDMLQKPDLAPTTAALKAASLLAPGLYELADGVVVINEAAAARYIDQATIYVDENELPVYEKLLQLRELLHELGMLAHNNEDRTIKPVNLYLTGLLWRPYFEGLESYYFDPQRLKEFLRAHKL